MNAVRSQATCRTPVLATGLIIVATAVIARHLRRLGRCGAADDPRLHHARSRGAFAGSRAADARDASGNDRGAGRRLDPILVAGAVLVAGLAIRASVLWKLEDQELG